mgnify:CR=1 FL=1
MSVKVEVWGEYACFTRMEFKSESDIHMMCLRQVLRGEYLKAYIGIMDFVIK